MILLTSATDRLQLITDVDGPVDVHTSWVDTVTSSGAITPGRTNTAITTIATTTIVGSPGVSTQRNVKTVHVRNKAGAAIGVLVQHTDGTTISQLYKTTLTPGRMLQYTDGGGFSVL